MSLSDSTYDDMCTVDLPHDTMSSPGMHGMWSSSYSDINEDRRMYSCIQCAINCMAQITKDCILLPCGSCDEYDILNCFQ